MLVHAQNKRKPFAPSLPTAQNEAEIKLLKVLVVALEQAERDVRSRASPLVP